MAVLVTAGVAPVGSCTTQHRVAQLKAIWGDGRSESVPGRTVHTHPMSARPGTQLGSAVIAATARAAHPAGSPRSSTASLTAASSGSSTPQQAVLEAELAAERRRAEEKDRLLDAMQQRLSKLEQSIEQQARDAEQDQQRIADLERRGTSQNVVATHSVTVKRSESPREETWRHAEEREKLFQKLQMQLRSVEYEKKCCEEQVLSKDRQLLEQRDRAKGLETANFDLQRQLVEKNREIQELKQRIAGSPRPLAPQGARGSPDAIGKHAVRLKGHLQSLQQLLSADSGACKSAPSDEGCGNSEERHSCIADVIHAISDFDEALTHQLSWEGAQRERDLCELQQELANELANRKQAQYQMLERERLLHEKDQEICELQAKLNSEKAARNGLRLPLPSKAEAEPEQLTFSSMTMQLASVEGPGFAGGAGTFSLPSTPIMSKRCCSIDGGQIGLTRSITIAAEGSSVVHPPMGKTLSASTDGASMRPRRVTVPGHSLSPHFAYRG